MFKFIHFRDKSPSCTNKDNALSQIKKVWIFNYAGTEYLTRATLSVALYARQMQFTWEHIHYLEVRPYQNVKSIQQAVFKLLR